MKKAIKIIAFITALSVIGCTPEVQYVEVAVLYEDGQESKFTMKYPSGGIHLSDGCICSKFKPVYTYVCGVRSFQIIGSGKYSDTPTTNETENSTNEAN